MAGLVMLSESVLLLVAVTRHAANHVRGWEFAIVVGAVLLASVIAIACVSARVRRTRETGDRAWAEFERQFRSYVDRIDRRQRSIDERE